MFEINFLTNLFGMSKHMWYYNDAIKTEFGVWLVGSKDFFIESSAKMLDPIFAF